MRVLVVEDEAVLADSIGEWLQDESHAVDIAYDGATALERTAVNDYDVIVLDRDIPGVHGDDVCGELVRAGATARVLMLTASAEVTDRVDGLRLGADDYLTKPFSFAELSARIAALGRRTHPALPPVLVRAGISLDPGKREVFRGRRKVDLSKKEFGLLAELMRAEGNVVSSEHLLEKVWDEFADPFTGAVRLTVLKLRRKLGDPPVVETVVGTGYRIP